MEKKLGRADQLRELHWQKIASKAGEENKKVRLAVEFTSICDSLTPPPPNTHTLTARLAAGMRSRHAVQPLGWIASVKSVLDRLHAQVSEIVFINKLDQQNRRIELQQRLEQSEQRRCRSIVLLGPNWRVSCLGLPDRTDGPLLENHAGSSTSRRSAGGRMRRRPRYTDAPTDVIRPLPKARTAKASLPAESHDCLAASSTGRSGS
jgi:hypothetical protein